MKAIHVVEKSCVIEERHDREEFLREQVELEEKKKSSEQFVERLKSRMRMSVKQKIKEAKRKAISEDHPEGHAFFFNYFLMMPLRISYMEQIKAGTLDVDKDDLSEFAWRIASAVLKVVEEEYETEQSRCPEFWKSEQAIDWYDACRLLRECCESGIKEPTAEQKADICNMVNSLIEKIAPGSFTSYEHLLGVMAGMHSNDKPLRFSTVDAFHTHLINDCDYSGGTMEGSAQAVALDFGLPPEDGLQMLKYWSCSRTASLALIYCLAPHFGIYSDVTDPFRIKNFLKVVMFKASFD